MNVAIKTEAPKSLTLTYDLFNLPTAQHKAGLAGLLVLLESLKAREIKNTPTHKLIGLVALTVELTEQTLGVLLDDVYDAKWVEKQSSTKWAGKEPKRIDLIKHADNLESAKPEKRFIYDDFEPSGNAFAFWLQGGRTSPWLKLWRDMLWGVLRAQPATRGEYEKRANTKPVDLTAKLWSSLGKAQDAQIEGKFKTEAIAGSVFVGAQDANAEQVSFVGQVEYNFLLHFWQFATPLFVPQIVDLKTGQREYAGYLLVIPEVKNLPQYVKDMVGYWKNLAPDTSGYRPRDALIDLPQEGGLEFLYQLARFRTNTLDVAYDVSAVELYHLQKQGNNVRMLAAERILPNARVLAQYESIRSVRANPYYKGMRIKNLLRENLWHHGADALFAHYPWEYFIKTSNSPRLPFFGDDVRRFFERLDQQLDLLKENNAMDNTNIAMREDVLARRIYRLIGEYVNFKTDARAKIKYKDLPRGEGGKRVYPKEFREAREKVVSEAFLAMRSRRAEDFVEYFTGTICSVPHFVQEPDYLDLTHALMHTPDTVKNLAMLALSAFSYLPGQDSVTNSPNESQAQGDAP
jgi:CRISPR-associated protein Cmx8